MTKWQDELSEYIRQGEPSKKEKSGAWQTAIGLQAVDNLPISEYLLATAKEHIEGKIDMPLVHKRLEEYYSYNKQEKKKEDTEEGDIVSARIAAILGERAFTFSVAELKNIHKRLFQKIFVSAGNFRDYNISKKEWVLNGESVIYAENESIFATLKYDFNEEKNFSYENISAQQAIKHIAKFISGIWQIHPFAEGNTRTVAVFLIKYLCKFGFDVNNDIFAANSWYFRNALVRANYSDLQNDIYATDVFLEKFFENLLFGAKHELKNRYLHIDFQNANNEISKCKNCILNYTLEEVSVLNLIKKNPKITQIVLAKELKKSVRTIHNIMAKLQEKGCLERKNGKRDGYWETIEK